MQIAVTGAHTLDSSMIRGELGMEFRDVDASIVETANDLLRLGDTWRNGPSSYGLHARPCVNIVISRCRVDIAPIRLSDD